ncbi:MAG: DUF3426 domain-containing protein [Phenylobacterium sp.]|nr:MAG: DUF3426 domain-containing protein [Phenylobacterium sp.]
MILTCPECATSYFVDDSRIPEAGRTVKCASCGARWTAKREMGEFTSADEAEAAPAPEPAAAPHPGDATPDDDLDIIAVEREPEPEPRRRPPASAKDESKGKVLVWASAAAVVVALVAGAIMFRGDVVRMWPRSQAAYASLGLSANSLGLVIEDLHAEPTFVGGRPVLSVTGAIRNVKDETVTSPAIRVNLLNRLGKPIAAKIAKPIDPRVPAGATRHFAIAISDPPANARDLEVVFETAAQRAASAPITPIAPPAPTEARPLPAGSPDALPEHG